MPDVVIENPVLNSPYLEPTRHFKFSDEGITDEIVNERRSSAYFIPIARPKKQGKQLAFNTEWTQDRIEENTFINQIRSRISIWRQGNYQGITKTTRRLLGYWRNPEREKKLFYCQIEALETAIYLAEVAHKYGDAWIENSLRQFNTDANPLLYRNAFKMATGSGKTVVMAMLIAWQTLNKQANPQDARFSDAFLIVTPGITIRDRLRVLLPNDPGNYYAERDILPPDVIRELGKAKIIITNFHGFKPREHSEGARLTKILATAGQEINAFRETPQQMVRRVCGTLGNKRNIMVINDEAHHCYRRRAGGEEVKLTVEERKEAEKRDEEARVWISGLEAVKAKIGVKAVYDLSATPFFLRGSGYPEGTLFPWVVSDFSLVDAIESGIVKVPRVPVSDDQMRGDLPTYRDLWLRIRDDLPKKGRGTEAVQGEPKLPAELQGALHSLYSNYDKYYQQWESHREGTPTVFIVVCNNTNVSKLVYDYIAGWEKPLPGGTSVVVPGALRIFSNEENGRWRSRPNTLLIDSEQLESGEGMTPEFKKIAAAEIEEFKAEYHARFPDKDAEALTDDDLLREVMNTVGKPGKLGEDIRAVVSVSMLSEGWDGTCVTCKDNTFPQLLLLHERAYDAAGRVYRAIVQSTQGKKSLKPILRPYDTAGSTRYVDFDTTKATYATSPDKCHVSRVVADTESWEQKLAQSLEDMDEVVSYVKNQGLGFRIPYTINGEEHNYEPDFLIRLRDAEGELLNRPGIPEVVNLQPVRGEAKPYQIRQFLDLVERYSLRLED